MDLLIIFIGIVLFVASIVLKQYILFMVAFLVIVFNDFVRITIIQKKKDERVELIKMKTDGITYFSTLGLLVVFINISAKTPNLFGSVSHSLCIVFITICLIHSIALSVFNRKY
ncbi:hypothetical protein [Clostridium hydrogenum]|uniref:hypothetical protein n=1 Tax=Clostridium hydrogenum TaxID=2855764 RepID=UPI001F2E9FA1|nr:hypothetical protein [Clostridium hydrogenum]